jgi:hypothetical protein
MRSFTLLLCLALLLTVPAFAQSGLQATDDNRPAATSWQDSLAAQQQAEVDRATKSALILELMEERQQLAGRTFDESWASRMKAYLDNLTLDQLQQAQELQRAGQSFPEKFLGDVDRDLVFTPLDKPCRFYDSRNTAQGRLTPGGGDRTISVSGGAIPPEQGAASFCAVLDSAVAVVINILAVDPLAQGNFQLWPADGTPGDSVINYGGPQLGINLINGVMVPICNPFLSVCPTDLVLRTNFASSHALLNVTGFFSPPEPSPLECQTVETSMEFTDQSFSFTSPDCPSGYSLTGGGHNWFFNTQDVWFWEVSPEGNHYRCRGRNFNTDASEITCFARCCRVPGEFGGVVL